MHHDEPVGERERLVVVVGHEQRGEPEPHEERAQLGDQPFAQRAVERAERLVEHEQPRLGGERAGERDALLLAARELADAPVLEAGEPDERECVAGARRRSSAAASRCMRSPKRDVAQHVAVGEQRVVLEHEPEARDGAGGTRARSSPSHATTPARVGLEPGDRAQQRALAAAARTEDADDLAVGDVEVDAVDRGDAVVRDA